MLKNMIFFLSCCVLVHDYFVTFCDLLMKGTSGLVIQWGLSYVTLLTADQCPQEGRAQFNYRQA